MTQPSCDSNEAPVSGFIGYRHLSENEREIVRIYLNCKDESQYEGPVDVFFGGPAARFGGLAELSVIRKFNRLIGALEERAREESVPRETVFRSAVDLLHFLSRIKNSRNFSKEKT